jgi:hypothetical protein
VLGDVSEPGQAPEVSLEQALEPAPLAALAGASADEPPVARARAAFELRRAELGRAVVLAEVLGPPLSLRG